MQEASPGPILTHRQQGVHVLLRPWTRDLMKEDSCFRRCCSQAQRLCSCSQSSPHRGEGGGALGRHSRSQGQQSRQVRPASLPLSSLRAQGGSSLPPPGGVHAQVLLAWATTPRSWDLVRLNLSWKITKTAYIVSVQT